MRILLTTLQYLGHVVPAAVFKHALEKRGHFVHWEICAVPPISGPLHKHLKQYEKQTPIQDAQLRRVLDSGDFDCLVSDPPIFAAWDIFRDGGVPAWAIFGNLPIFYVDERVPLYLQCSLPDFEPAVRAPNVKFIGPMVPKELIPKGKKPWWIHNGKIVHVTEGTVAQNGLVARVLGVKGPRTWSVVPEYFDYCHWMGEIDCFVTNGGFSGVSQALFYGVPMVLAGETEDKIQVSERVAAMGCGINLKTATPTCEMLKKAIETCLSDEGLKENCKKMAKKCQFFRPEQGVDHLEALTNYKIAKTA